jgi:hypothetical protein
MVKAKRVPQVTCHKIVGVRRKVETSKWVPAARHAVVVYLFDVMQVFCARREARDAACRGGGRAEEALSWSVSEMVTLCHPESRNSNSTKARLHNHVVGSAENAIILGKKRGDGVAFGRLLYNPRRLIGARRFYSVPRVP